MLTEVEETVLTTSANDITVIQGISDVNSPSAVSYNVRSGPSRQKSKDIHGANFRNPNNDNSM
jgi:hypothetical protein